MNIIKIQMFLFILLFLKFFKIELDDEDLKELNIAFEYELKESDEFNNPDERIEYLNILKNSVDNDTEYIFSNEGLMDKINKDENPLTIKKDTDNLV